MARKKEMYIDRRGFGIRYHYTLWNTFNDGDYLAFDLKPSGWRAICCLKPVAYTYWHGNRYKKETYDLDVTLKDVLENIPDEFKEDILQMQQSMIAKIDTKINRQEKQLHKREDELEDVL